MLLDRKVAIVYGAAGSIGSAVANAYAREGAQVHLAGRTPDTLGPVAAAIRDSGGLAHIAAVDTINPTAVRDHADAVAASSGRIDICFNATSNDDLQGTALIDINFADLMRPVTKAVTSQFNIAAAVAPHMIREGRGVILAMAGGREAIPNLGGSHVAWAALAGLCRQLAAELGPHGIRVAWVLSPGSPDDDDQPENGGSVPGTGGLRRVRLGEDYDGHGDQHHRWGSHRLTNHAARHEPASLQNPREQAGATGAERDRTSTPNAGTRRPTINPDRRISDASRPLVINGSPPD
jgi:NAD(P)-dependent dehydrogenase (short-subunit alcohol dehydrogenase family)